MTTKFFSIFISGLILFQSFNIHLGDVLKLEELIDHVEFHEDKYGDDFFVFLSKHYGELKQSHKEQHEKEEKDHTHPPINHDCSSQLQSSFVMNSNSFTMERLQIERTTTIFLYQDNFSTFEKQKIFQPPQFS
ncbi:MAG: hypothetical protein KAH67_04965 [Flavobacteriaceae bacterium]|nr:hypothetical protein [Flavobacteriaceae bacterium]